MNEQEQRIAIAEACGWKWYLFGRNTDETAYLLLPKSVAKGGHEMTPGEARRYMDASRAPDYLHDLNAMRAALATMTPAQWMTFGELLLWILGHCDDYYDGWILGPSVVEEILKVDPPTLSEVFLQATGKWKK